jgi:hypothetical protein
MKHVIPTMVLAATTTVVATQAAGQQAFSTIVEHYEAIRQILIEDSTNAIAGHAEAIAATTVAFRHDFSAAAAGIDPGDAEAVKALLPEIEERASSMATADGLEEVRAALAELTKPLVRWHELIEGARPVVAYCPMEKRAWLQPDEAIGNPYAPYMLRCGEVVQR